jgi:predicted glutamine amidotransferase
MAQFLAAIANDAEHMPSLLYALRNVLVHPEPEDGDVWGLGYYADDHALTIRKPGELLNTRDFYELASAVKSQVVCAFVRPGWVAPTQAPPHRFRRWLFGSIGDLSPLEGLHDRIRDALPSFIRSELGQAGLPELPLAMFLREQHERGLLTDALATGAGLADALRRTTDTIARLATEAGVEPPRAAYAATNGRVIIVSRQGRRVYWKRQEGLEALPGGPPDPDMNDFKAVVKALKRFRAIVFSSNLAEDTRGWNEMADGETVWVDRQLAVTRAAPTS